MKRYQRTIKKPVSFEGVGLHSGQQATIRLLPAEADQGISFVRVDVEEQPHIPASIEFVTQRRRQTALSNNGVEIHTCEHLLAALTGLGIDNVTIEIDAPELPGADGSSQEFVDLIRGAGIAELPQTRQMIKIEEPISCSDGDISLVALPSKSGEYSISYTLDYNQPGLRSQHFTCEINEETFPRDIGSARTFCLDSEVEELRAVGLGKGANYANTLVIGAKGVIKNKLRFPDEPVRHKILDLVGDLSLIGGAIIGHIVAVKSGHKTNVELAQKLYRYMAKKNREQAANRKGVLLDIQSIKSFLPHRYPFLLVDKIIHIEDGKKVIGLKNVSFNEEYFQGHFPNRAVMPGVLQIEALAQTAGFLLMRKFDERNTYAYLATLDKVKMRRAVEPGDQLLLEAEALKIKTRSSSFRTRALVDGNIATEAEMKFILVDAP